VPPCLSLLVITSINARGGSYVPREYFALLNIMQEVCAISLVATYNVRNLLLN
jgi:hypothetical protein